MDGKNVKRVARRRGLVLVLTLACAVALVAGAAAGSSDAPEPARSPAPAASAAAETPPECPKPKRGVWRRGAEDERSVALTFDDGPSAQTEMVLRALERHDAKGTFFVVGREIPGRVDVLREAAEAGHEIGNHSTSHDLLPGRDDIDATSAMIAEATGAEPCVFRPPHGKASEKLLRDVRRLGMTTVTWDVDTADWASQLPDAIRDRALEGVEPGSIILMHDGGGDRAGTARSLSVLIEELRGRGYELVTVSELLRDSPLEEAPSPGTGVQLPR